MLLIIALAVVVIVGGGVAIVREMRHPEGVRRLREAPVVAIAVAGDAADARIEGVVAALDGTVDAPLTGVRCVYYEHTRARIENAGVGNAFAPVGQVFERRTDGVPFIVRDASGYAIVDPAGVVALLDLDFDITEPQGALGPSLGSALRGRSGVRQEERRIVAGDTIVVIGRGVREPDPDPSRVVGAYRAGPPTRLRFTSSPQFPLHLLDRSRAPKR